ncbi:MAG TPA: hypothetical protein VGK19_15955 [Capsulimonadaceae bacterium]|jgi:hydrogenase-4 component E
MVLAPTIEAVSAALVVLSLWMIGISQYVTSVRLFAVQSITLGALAAYIGMSKGEPMMIVVGIAVAIFKGGAVPSYLAFAGRKIGCRNDSSLSIAPPLQIFLAGSVVAFLSLSHPFRGELPATAIPCLDILLIGMLLMVTRRLALSQIIGFLVIENGIFLYTISQTYGMPVLVELGVLMDVLAITMLAGLLVYRISSTFEHVDVTKMKELKG